MVPSGSTVAFVGHSGSGKSTILNLMLRFYDAGREEIIKAACASNAHDFICALPSGYQTMVGERGVTLSGGERQHIAITRAILKDAPILFLDEATSSADARSEEMVQKADMIFILEDGQLMEKGTHESLLSEGKVYHALIKAQEAICS